MEHSPELEKVRQLLFPDLTVEEGWARIDAALEGAADPKKLDAIEEVAAGDLSGDLAAAVRRLHEREETPPAA
ncbi:MAG TPA: hypothetical protein VFU56_03970 [Gaiellaceae bacterium]|nr:hypothetical protein [Gaiellaceae bacterium]